MSEDRYYDMAFTRTVASTGGNICTRIECYKAGKFKTRLDGRNFSTNMPAQRSKRAEFYDTMFRVRVDGKWYGNRSYHFFTKKEIADILLSF